eukprot:scaffold15052_cov61-Skeletonema_dohrnii-CCMP3373.AAC.1
MEGRGFCFSLNLNEDKREAVFVQTLRSRSRRLLLETYLPQEDHGQEEDRLLHFSPTNEIFKRSVH